MTHRDVSEICKRDTRGRVRRTAEQRQVVLEQFERSGLSSPEFARVAGLNYQTFATWRQRRQKAKSGALAQPCSATAVSHPVSFVEACWPSPDQAGHPGAALQIVLPGGATLMVAEVAQVPLAAQLLQALRLPC